MAETKRQKKKRTRAPKGQRLLPILGLLMAAALLAAGGWFLWQSRQVYFRDVTVELGTQSLSIRDFLTEKADPGQARFVTDPGTIDIGQVGKTQVTLKHGLQEATVTLTVRDTTAPTGLLEEAYDIFVPGGIPLAASLVRELSDQDAVTVYYAREPQIPRDYGPTEAEIVLEDASGNKTVLSTQLLFHGWFQEQLTLELGTALTPEMLFTDPGRDAGLLDSGALAAASALGQHTLTVDTGTVQATCLVTVQDTTAPQLELQNLHRYPWETAQLEDFVVSAQDLSGDPVLRLESPLPDFTGGGTHTVVISATDSSGNTARKEATLWISTNKNPPEIHGTWDTITLQKHQQPDLLEGIFARDDVDGTIPVTVDTSALDLSKPGTYYVTYTATDSSGNVTTARRRIVVEPDEADTAQLVIQLAATLPDDPMAIRDFVHDTIAYSGDWGGDNPVWHGFNQYSGNCFVHALCLQALLDCKGYEARLIWVTNESHYWVIVKTGEGWRHIDSTPSYQHERIGLATDDVRYENLNGRDWDRSQWPACE